MTQAQTKLRAMIVEKAFAEAAIAQAKLEMTQANEKLQSAREYFQQIQAQIDFLRAEAAGEAPHSSAQKTGPIISDRATLDYIAKNLGFDLEQVRSMIREDLNSLKVEMREGIVLAIGDAT